MIIANDGSIDASLGWITGIGRALIEVVAYHAHVKATALWVTAVHSTFAVIVTGNCSVIASHLLQVRMGILVVTYGGFRALDIAANIKCGTRNGTIRGGQHNGIEIHADCIGLVQGILIKIVSSKVVHVGSHSFNVPFTGCSFVGSWSDANVGDHSLDIGSEG